MRACKQEYNSIDIHTCTIYDTVHKFKMSKTYNYYHSSVRWMLIIVCFIIAMQTHIQSKCGL